MKTLPDGNNDIRTWMRSCVHGYGDVRTWMRSCVHGYRDVRTLRLTPAVGERRTPRPCCSWSPLWGHWTPPWCPCTPPHSSWSSGTPSCLFGILHSLLDVYGMKCTQLRLGLPKIGVQISNPQYHQFHVLQSFQIHFLNHRSQRGVEFGFLVRFL